MKRKPPRDNAAAERNPETPRQGRRFDTDNQKKTTARLGGNGGFSASRDVFVEQV